MKVVVAENKFREDLFYRLNVFPLNLSPLRDRRGDIVPLAKRLLEKHARTSTQIIPEFSDDACASLLRHAWPGNIRELDNVIQRALILHADTVITEQDLHFEVATSHASEKPSVASVNIPASHPVSERIESKDDSLNSDLKQREWDLILDAIRHARGSRKVTAERLGISQRTLRYKLARMREAGITVPGSSDTAVSDNIGTGLGAAGLETA